jgi:aminopeptidase
MGDPRLDRYAALLVEQCLDVQPGTQVLVHAQPLARPLVEAVASRVARRGAYAIVRVTFELMAVSSAWIRNTPEELLREPPSVEVGIIDALDYLMHIHAPDNTREGSDVPAERLALLRQAYRPHFEKFFSEEARWVGCQYPTAALAQDAGMTLPAFEDFLYGAVLIDWGEARASMQRIADRFEGAAEVRVAGEGTDIRFSLEGRKAKIDAAGANMPGGEVFFSPVEDSVEGAVTFSEYPACYSGHQVPGVRLRFAGGRVVDASAAGDEQFLLATLDTDEGARRLGEFGIGCNPGIQQHMRNTLFDEKIEGTVHFAVGNGFPFIGGQNQSAVHWDMVKDLRRGGRIELDGEVVQENGAWSL